jgi:hypothetical protein
MAQCLHDGGGWRARCNAGDGPHCFPNRQQQARTQ